MKEYQSRVIKEKEDLDGNIKKLSEFINSEHLKTVSDDNQNLLRRQYHVMMEYSDVLNRRIILF